MSETLGSTLNAAANRRRLGAGVLVVAALAVGRVVTDRLPTTEIASRPYERHAVVGETVPMRVADLTVTEVQGSPTLVTTTEGYRTPGLWIAAFLTVVPREKTSTVTYAAIRATDGRTWETKGRNRMLCASGLSGLPTRCAAYVDVPPEALPGASLLVARGGGGGDLRMDDMAVIDLGITKQKVQEWQQRTTPIEAPLPKVGEP